MTRPGPDQRHPRTGSDAPDRARFTRSTRALSRSSLWDEGEPGPQPLKASWDPIEAPARAPQRSRQRPDRPQKRRSAIGWFFHHYGWRAYAIPVLLALTVLTIIQIIHDNTASAAAAQEPPGSPVSQQVTVVSGVTSTVYVTPPATNAAGVAPSQAAVTDTAATSSGAEAPDPNGAFKDLPTGVLPGGAAFTAQGKGTWHVVAGTGGPFGKGPTHKTYKIEVEDGIQSAEADKEFASAVDSTLADPRSWIGSGNFTLQRVSSGDVDFTIALTSQMTERKNEVCGWEIQLEASCYARDLKRVSINNARWTRGAVVYNGDLGMYRIYAINHEVGHALGFRHQPCAENGGLAPVMMQQSWSTSNDALSVLDPQTIPRDGKVCHPNPFPYPRAGAASGGPGTGVGVTTSAGG